MSITSLVLGQLTINQRQVAEQLREQEVLNLAIMAVQTGQNQLSLDGLSVQVERYDWGLVVRENGWEVIRLEKD